MQKAMEKSNKTKHFECLIFKFSRTDGIPSQEY